MTRTPSSNAACASLLVFGTATTAMALPLAPGGGACPHAAAATMTTLASNATPSRSLLVTAHLFDPLERDARLPRPRRQPDLRLLRVLVLRQPRQRLADGLGVLVVDADLQRLGVAGLVGVE